MELGLILRGKEEVTELYPVPDSHVPVTNFKFNGISIDLVYARLSLWAIPDVVSVLCFLSIIIRNMFSLDTGCRGVYFVSLYSVSYYGTTYFLFNAQLSCPNLDFCSRIWTFLRSQFYRMWMSNVFKA